MKPTTKRISPAQFDLDEELPWPVLSRQACQALLLQKPQLSIWQVVVAQSIFVFASTAAAALLLSPAVWLSWGAGCAVALLPTALLANGIIRSRSSPNPSQHLLALFFWELLKWAISVAMIVLVARSLSDMLWLVFLLGLFVTYKVQWLMMMKKML